MDKNKITDTTKDFFSSLNKKTLPFVFTLAMVGLNADKIDAQTLSANQSPLISINENSTLIGQIRSARQNRKGNSSMSRAWQGYGDYCAENPEEFEQQMNAILDFIDENFSEKTKPVKELSALEL